MTWDASRAGSATTSEGVLGCAGSQVRLVLVGGSVIFGEIVRGLHHADGVTTVALRPWGVSHLVDFTRAEIKSATVAHVRWAVHHAIACEQARRSAP